MPEDPTERLQKILAHAGIASRRQAEELIRQGRVTVNGRVVTQLGTKVSPAHDDIRVDGQRIQAAPDHVYILLNKPRGYLSTMEDTRGRKALGDLVTAPARLYPVGRLDVNSEGLVLLTDDGELANLLTHPRYKHEKEYRVLVAGHPADKTLQAWRRGVVLDGKPTAPAQVDVWRSEKDSTLLRIVMHEGRKRQIRSVAKLLGHRVLELKRVRIGPLQLGTLEVGKWRYLTPRELHNLDLLKQSGERGRLAKRRSRSMERGAQGERR
jgi:23S rRNA pseudouridine2605 synthase